MIRSTYLSSSLNSSSVRERMPYLHERELDNILNALADGRLVAIAQDGEIIAAATPEVADELTKRDNEVIDELLKRLGNADKELRSLRQIMREVLAESEPSDFSYRVDDAIDDVERELDRAIGIAEDM
jgi:hypothetical protein